VRAQAGRLSSPFTFGTEDAAKYSRRADPDDDAQHLGGVGQVKQIVDGYGHQVNLADSEALGREPR
jgi:hypothetical protein